MNKPLTQRPQQRGTVLLVAMIMLLVMTLLGINSMRGTALEERMAGNWRDQNIALQAAEAALRGAERSLPGVRPEPLGTVADGCPADSDCSVYEMDTDDPATFNYLLDRPREKGEMARQRDRIRHSDRRHQRTTSLPDRSSRYGARLPDKRLRVRRRG